MSEVDASTEMEATESNEIEEQDAESDAAEDSESVESEEQESDEDDKPKAKQASSQSNSKQGEKNTKPTVKKLSEADDDAIVTVKINGEVRELTMRELKKGYGLEQASRERMNKVAAKEKGVDSLIRLAKEDPRQFFKVTGVDPFKFSEELLAEKFEEMNMTDEQRELKQLRQTKKSWEEQEAARKKDIESAQMREQEAKVVQQLDSEIADAWKESGLPADKHFVAQIAAVMYASEKQAEKGVIEKPLSAKEATVKVKETWGRNTRSVLEKMDAAAIRDTLGDKVLKALKEFDIKKASDHLDPFNRGPGKSPASPTKQTQKKSYSELEWRKVIDAD